MSGLSVNTAGDLGVIVASRGRRSAVSRVGGAFDVVAGEIRGVLACESNKLIALAALRDLDVVPVEPCLQLGVAPAVEKLFRERGLSTMGRRGRRCGSGRSRIGGDTGVIEPSFQIGVGPALVEPVTGVVKALTELVGGCLVVGASGVEKRVTGAWGWVGDVMVVEERLQLRLSPAKMESV